MGGITRTDVLNHLALKYNLQRYLEIGVQDKAQNFDKVVCRWKVGVDPDPKAGADFCMTSDEFFSIPYRDITGWELIFIDGLHEAQQVGKDFRNSLKILSPNGFIILHDCNPEKEEHTTIPRPKPTGHWNGDVYKFVSRISLNEQYCTVDVDCGCGVWKNDPTKPVVISDHIPSWTEFVHQRNQYLKLIDWNEFLAL